MKKLILYYIVLLIFSNNVYAFETKKYNEIIESLRCLVCQNQSLAESDSSLAKDLRSKVKELIKNGKSSDEIYKFMSDRYTDYVLYNPPVKKSTIFLWYGPFIILTICLIFLFWKFIFKKKIHKENIIYTKNNNEEDFIQENKISNKQIILFLLFFVPIISVSIYSYSSELMRYKISHFFQSKEPVINITIQIHDSLLEKITGNEILFVYARRSSGMRVPLAINIFDVKKQKRNYNVKLDNTMYMINNQTLSSTNEVIIEARVSKEKKAAASPGDYIGTSLPIVLESSNYVLLKIDSIVTSNK